MRRSATPMSLRSGHFRVPNAAVKKAEARLWAQNRALPTAKRFRSVFAIEPDQLALNLDPIRRQDTHLVGGVGRFQGDRGAAAAETLQGGFLVVDQRHHDVAG